MSTCAPRAVADLAARVEALGRRFVDAPVSGGFAGVKAAALTVMAAAPAPLVDRARPAFEALGDKIFHVGDKPGQGAAVKTVNQLLCDHRRGARAGRRGCRRPAATTRSRRCRARVVRLSLRRVPPHLAREAGRGGFVQIPRQRGI